VQLLCRVRFDERRGRLPELLMALIDITERRELEITRAKSAQEHAAVAIRLLSAQDEERHRIARELHDNIGQQVTALRLILQAAQHGAINGAVRAHVDRAQALVERLDEQLDFVTGEMRASSLHLGLVPAVEQFVREWSAMFGIAAAADCVGVADLQLDRAVETHLYRVVQEAINNIHKHASATRVSVVLERQDSGLVLTVEDNGRGFDAAAEAQNPGRGLGLASMRERAQLIGGTLEIQSVRAKGTTIVVRVPIAGRTESR